jgi:hypothetical protein
MQRTYTVYTTAITRSRFPSPLAPTDSQRGGEPNQIDAGTKFSFLVAFFYRRKARGGRGTLALLWFGSTEEITQPIYKSGSNDSPG